MTIVSAVRVETPAIVDTIERYHAAINALDFKAIESFFAETAVYLSDGVGVLEGRDAIMASFCNYFLEYRDQHSVDDSMEAISDRAVRSAWRLTATSSKTGEKLMRRGEETAFLDQDGLIEKVVVRDGPKAANEA